MMESVDPRYMSTHCVPTLAELHGIMQQARKLRNSDVPDLILMTHATEQKIRACPEVADCHDAPGFCCGIPVEAYPTKEDVVRRTIELHGSGKNLRVIYE